MPAMKTMQTSRPCVIEVVEAERPVPGPQDVLTRVRACGIRGTDATFVHLGGMPAGQTRPISLGHEPAGEIIEAAAAVTGLKPGDRVVAGRSVAAFPDTLPFEVAALNEPMAVARHCVNRAQADPGDKAVVFGAGPNGLGVTIWLKLAGIAHVAMADVIPARLRTALAVGADAVIDSSREDAAARLAQLHGQCSNALGAPRPGADLSSAQRHDPLRPPPACTAHAAGAGSCD